MSTLLHLALAQFKPHKGNYAANLGRLREIFAAAHRLEPRPQLLLLPETSLTGYFVEGGVRDLAVTAGRLARDLDCVYREALGGDGGDGGGGVPALDVAVGFYERWQDTLYNAAMYLSLGTPDEGRGTDYTIRHVHRKNFLPTYGLFDEERFVERGHEIRAFDTGWGRVALLVCEDAWHSLSGTIAALDGAQVVLVSSAAHARGVWPRDDGVPGPATVARWERLIRDIAEEHGVYCALANLVGSEGGKSFSGASLVVGPQGDVRVRGPVFDEALVALTVDLGDLVRARADSPLLADLRTALPHLRELMDEVEAGIPARVDYDDDSAEYGADGRRADSVAAARETLPPVRAETPAAGVGAVSAGNPGPRGAPPREQSASTPSAAPACAAP